MSTGTQQKAKTRSGAGRLFAGLGDEEDERAASNDAANEADVVDVTEATFLAPKSRPSDESLAEMLAQAEGASGRRSSFERATSLALPP
jgi:hypothetical protein